MATKVTTNHHWRDIFCLEEIPEAEQGNFPYLQGDARNELRMFEYKGTWYDAHEFEVSPIPGWDGAHADTMWTAIVIRVRPDDQAVMVGRAVTD